MLFHMYWACPSLVNFWELVLQTIQHQIEPDPLIAIFGIAPNLDLPRAKLNMLAFTTLLARRAILLRWKDAPPHTSTPPLIHTCLGTLCLVWIWRKSVLLPGGQWVNSLKCGASSWNFLKNPLQSFLSSSTLPLFFKTFYYFICICVYVCICIFIYSNILKVFVVVFS